MKNIKRKGFTLVELLIVIVVIGILSAMMMLSSMEAVTSAKASNIVSDLRNFKTAAMAMYVDHYDKMDTGDLPDTDDKSNALLQK
ncbi:MAG: prepilin-type N-terminal cleavage/methylation domain-containing protein [Synergistaceae bacterium]|nr:prepilin-type N-terminal cleavage/methylation domain-containing protein [Synergistaceae bacterium]